MTKTPIKCYGSTGRNGNCVKIIDNEFIEIDIEGQKVQFTPEAALGLAKQLALAAAKLS